MTEEHVTTTAQKALKTRAHMKRKKPKFARPESWRYTRLKENWRRPRGLDNKMRRKIKGWPPTASVGYRGPKAARGLHPSGYKEVMIYNAEQLKEVDPKTQVARIAHTVGKRTRTKILAEARKKKIIILNLREAKKAVSEKEEKAEEKEEEKEAVEEVEEEKPKRRRARAKKQKGEVEDSE